MSIPARMRIVALLLMLGSGGCGVGPFGCGFGVERDRDRGPNEATLRDAFVAQLSANRFVTGLNRSGNDATFSGPDVQGNPGRWRVRIDAAQVEASDSIERPYKGIVRSTWYLNDQPVVPSRGESNLPLELTSNGLAQECWAFFEKSTMQWSWE